MTIREIQQLVKVRTTESDRSILRKAINKVYEDYWKSR